MRHIRVFRVTILLIIIVCVSGILIAWTVRPADLSCLAHQPLRPVILSGPDAFYNQPDYVERTRRDFESTAPLPPSEVFEFESSTTRRMKDICSTLVFPWGMYRYLHTAYGKQFFKSAQSSSIAKEARRCINLDSDFKYYRLTLLVDNMPVDAMIVGRPSTLGNQRWMVFSLGITKVYECLLIDHPETIFPRHPPGLSSLQQLLTQTNSNAVFYNYPGMGESGAAIDMESMTKVHEAVLQFIEHRFQANAIVDEGHSFGGGNQAEVWRTHHVKPGVRYVLIKDRTFVHMSDAVENLAGRIMSTAGVILGWQSHSVPSSDALKVPEIHIMCVRNIDRPRLFTDVAQIASIETDSSTPTYNDAVIPYHTSTAIHYLLHPSHDAPKIIMGVPEVHGVLPANPTLLAEVLNTILAPTTS